MTVLPSPPPPPESPAHPRYKHKDLLTLCVTWPSLPAANLDGTQWHLVIPQFIQWLPWSRPCSRDTAALSGLVPMSHGPLSLLLGSPSLPLVSPS